MKKGKKTKELILEKAAMLFAQKGYATVSMKDICESTDLSRGGLYRHFASTKEIFIAILNRDLEMNSITVDNALRSNTPAEKILQHYLIQEKNAVFSSDCGFYFAIHEFAFLEPDQRLYFNIRVKKSSEILSKILSYGQKREEFRQFDYEVASRHLLYFWDSLKTSSPILDVTEDEVDKQIQFIMEMLT